MLSRLKKKTKDRGVGVWRVSPDPSDLYPPPPPHLSKNTLLRGYITAKISATIAFLTLYVILGATLHHCHFETFSFKYAQDYHTSSEQVNLNVMTHSLMFIMSFTVSPQKSQLQGLCKTQSAKWSAWHLLLHYLYNIYFPVNKTVWQKHSPSGMSVRKRISSGGNFISAAIFL